MSTRSSTSPFISSTPIITLFSSAIYTVPNTTTIEILSSNLPIIKDSIKSKPIQGFIIYIGCIVPVFSILLTNAVQIYNLRYNKFLFLT